MFVPRLESGCIAEEGNYSAKDHNKRGEEEPAHTSHKVSLEHTVQGDGGTPHPKNTSAAVCGP